MVNTSLILYYLAHQRLSFKTIFFKSTTLALMTTLFVLFYISSSTSHLICFNHHHTRILSVSRKNPPIGSSSFPDVSKHHHPFVDLSMRNGSGGKGRSMRQPSAGIDCDEMFKMVHVIYKRRKTVGGSIVSDEGATRSATGAKLKLDNMAWINYQ